MMERGQTKVPLGSSPIFYPTGQPFESEILAGSQTLFFGVWGRCLLRYVDTLEGVQARQQQKVRFSDFEVACIEGLKYIIIVL